jgi:predicted peroxiredoxin
VASRDGICGTGYKAHMPGRTVVFVSHADPSALKGAGSAALAAVALEDRVDVFLTGPAVSAVVAAFEGELDEPAALLHQARRLGARLIACSASVVDEKVDLAAAQAALDAVVGWPTILEWSRGVVDRFAF